ncbi:MAG: thiopeptide-type bacteriocin biosynthesis protein, partial [Gemmatimonas sp.]
DDEALHEPDAVFAEIVHLPQGRFGNFIARPRFRTYEIAFLGAGAASAEETLGLDDLFLVVRNGRLQLRSQRLAREVKPRLSNAHHPGAGSYDLAIYRFLYELQFQDVNVMSLAVRELDLLPYSPRIMYRHLVLALARWNIEASEMHAVPQKNGQCSLESFRDWQARRGLPRYVVLEKGDNRLLLDLDNPICADILVDTIRKQPTGTVLVEQFPPPNAAPVHGPDGAHSGEFVVAMNRAHRTPQRSVEVVSSKPSALGERSTLRPVPVRVGFAPGSEWVYAKLYTGHATADRLLRGSISTIVHELQALEPDVRWFYIRYADPDFHLRFRVHSVREEVHARLRSLLADLYTRHRGTGELHRLVLEAYEPEIDRYGGDKAIGLAEQLFAADSNATLGALESDVLGDANMRWQFACAGVHRLLEDFGYPLEDRARLLGGLTDSYRHAFGRHVDIQRTLRTRIAQKYRVLRPSLSLLLGADVSSVHVDAERLLHARSLVVRRVATEYQQLERANELSRPLTVIVQSFVHMHVNRVLRSDHQRNERVLYDLLAQHYRGSLARGRAADQSR